MDVGRVVDAAGVTVAVDNHKDRGVARIRRALPPVTGNNPAASNGCRISRG